MSDSALALQLADYIRRWHGIAPPSAAAPQALAELEAVIAALAELDGTVPFDCEPAEFAAALEDCRAP
ncbi:hypothetical protein ACI6QG_01950 [Roseococcus sp. DSY-14]|uniref:hypothetical protein n=1 Tax=Roseococcus sp. DSY-14 TaxID=3369650 RepID=UPI00387B7B3B